jgi:hypothetical protein
MTMRHKLYHFILLTGFIALVWYSTARAVSLEIVPASQTILIGTSTTVDLVIAGLGHGIPPALSTFDLNVRFDPAILRLPTTDANGDGVIDSVDIDPTNQLDVLGLGGNIMMAGLTGAGTLHLFDLSFDLPGDLTTRQAGSFALATLTFESLAGGTSGLSLNINALGDAEGNPLTATVSGASVTATPEPGTWLLLASGSLGLLGYGWRRRSRGR